MRVNDLYLEVAQLGFEDSLEEDSRFYYAANRALLQVNAIRPAISVFVINHKPMKNLVTEDTFSPIEVSAELCFDATNAKAFYVEADGNGTLYIEAQDDAGDWSIIGTQALSSKRHFIPYKGFIKKDGGYVTGRVRLRFTGAFLYSIKNVAMYQHIYSDDAEDIPAYEPFTRYDLADLVDDFLSLNAPPIKEISRELLNQDYDVEDGKIVLLPYHAEGCFKIEYKRRPKKIDTSLKPTENTMKVDLDEELCALLPLLIASHVWAEDEPEKAQYYLTLYRERAFDIEKRIEDTSPIIIKNRSGW